MFDSLRFHDLPAVNQTHLAAGRAGQVERRRPVLALGRGSDTGELQEYPRECKEIAFPVKAVARSGIRTGEMDEIADCGLRILDEEEPCAVLHLRSSIFDLWG